MSLSIVLQFLRSRESRRSHAVLLISSFAAGLGFYGLHQYQTLTINDLFRPEPIWAVYWIPTAFLWYAGWIVGSVLISKGSKKSLEEALKEDAVCYAPTFLLIGLWIKHLEAPSVLIIIPVFAGFLALKLRPLLHFIKPGGLSQRLWPMLLIVAIIAYTATFSIMGGLRFLAFRTFVDFSLFVHQIWHYSNFDFDFLLSMGWPPFANHFSPILVLLAPFYWIYEHPITIITVNSAVIALGAVPLYRYATERLADPAAGLAMAVAYLLYPAVQFPALGDFHESLLIGTPVLFGFYYLYRRKYRMAWIFILLVLMCKEDTPIIVFTFGAYAWLIQHQRRQGLAMAAVAVIWLVVSVGVIVPASQGGDNWYLQFVSLSDSSVANTLPLTERLVNLAGHFFSMKNLVFILQLLIPVGGMALLAPAEFMIGVPTLLELMLYTGPPFGMVGTIYTWHTIAVVPAFFIGAVSAIEKLGKAAWFRSIPGNRFPRRLCLLYLCLSSAGASIAYGAFPYSISFRTNDFQVTPHDRTGLEIIKTIPPDVSVATTSQMSAHLAHREKIYLLPIPFKSGDWLGPESARPKAVDYIVADTSSAVLAEMTAGQSEGFLNEVRNIARHPDYQTVIARDGYVVFRNIHRTSP